jgi:hypothetical protein
MPLVWTLCSVCFTHRLTTCSFLPLVCPTLLIFAIPSTCIQFSPLLTSGSYVEPWVLHISAPYPLSPAQIEWIRQKKIIRRGDGRPCPRPPPFVCPRPMPPPVSSAPPPPASACSRRRPAPALRPGPRLLRPQPWLLRPRRATPPPPCFECSACARRIRPPPSICPRPPHPLAPGAATTRLRRSGCARLPLAATALL